ncbi:hypothetical protein PG990_005290 [Apiospora arundinis]
MEGRETKRDRVNRYKDTIVGCRQRAVVGLAIQNWEIEVKVEVEVEVEGVERGRGGADWF